MGFLGTLLGSQAGGLGFNLLGGLLGMRNFNRFQENVEQNYNQPLQEFAQQSGLESGQTPQQYAEDQLSGVVPAYQNLFNQARSLQNQTSEQSIDDINAAYDVSGAQAQSDLRSRGLSGSTIGINAANANTAGRAAALNRGRDLLLQQGLGVLGSFGAAVPQAQMDIGQYLSNNNLAARGQGLGAFTSQAFFPPQGFNMAMNYPYGGTARPS